MPKPEHTELPIPSVLSEIQGPDTAALRRSMKEHLNLSEIGELWFDLFGATLGNDVPGRDLSQCIIELLIRMQQRNKMSLLLSELELSYPHVMEKYREIDRPRVQKWVPTLPGRVVTELPSASAVENRRVFLLIALKPVDPYASRPAYDASAWKMIGDEGKLESIVWTDRYDQQDELRRVPPDGFSAFLEDCFEKLTDDILDLPPEHVIIEVLLPDEKLGEYPPEWERGERQKIGRKQPVIVRPRRRLERKGRWPEWKAGWKSLQQEEPLTPERIFWYDQKAEPDWETLTETLERADIHGVVFKYPIPADWYVDLIDALLISGVCLAAWPHADAKTESWEPADLRNLITSGGLTELPHRWAAATSPQRKSPRATLLLDDYRRCNNLPTAAPPLAAPLLEIPT